MTVREFYREHARNGRAVICGTEADPWAWFVLVTAETFAVCYCRREAIDFIGGERPVERFLRYLDANVPERHPRWPQLVA